MSLIIINTEQRGDFLDVIVMEFNTYTYRQTFVSVYCLPRFDMCEFNIYNKLIFFSLLFFVHEALQEYQHSFTITSTAVFFAIETV